MLVSPKVGAAQALQGFIESATSWLGERNLDLSVEFDMAAWARHMRSAPGTDVVNPTFDPGRSAVDSGNAYWIALRQGGTLAASIAARLFETGDYLELKRSLRLWFDKPPRAERISLHEEAELPRIAGRVGHNGGLWVHPTWRKHGLSSLLPRLNRAFILREFEADWDAGVTRAPITDKGFAGGAYGYPHVRIFFDGIFPVTGAPERMSMCYADRAEAIASLMLPLPGSSETTATSRSILLPSVEKGSTSRR